MTYKALAKVKKNSPEAALTAGISGSDTTIPVDHLEYFRDADGTLIVDGIVIWDPSDPDKTTPEEISITGASDTSGTGTLTGATRGVNADGSIGAAKSWSLGAKIAVHFTTGKYQQIADNIADLKTNKNWTPLIPGVDFSTTGANWVTITMLTDQTANIPVGSPIKYTYNGTVYYGVITALTANLMTLAGVGIGTGAGWLTSLSYGDASRVEQMDIIVNGYYETADDAAVVFNQLNASLVWQKPKAYAVRCAVWSKICDSGTIPGQVAVLINGGELTNLARGSSIEVGNTWYSSTFEINPAAYDINPTEPIEVKATKGTNGDARDLVVSIIFVKP